MQAFWSLASKRVIGPAPDFRGEDVLPGGLDIRTQRRDQTQSGYDDTTHAQLLPKSRGVNPVMRGTPSSNRNGGFLTQGQAAPESRHCIFRRQARSPATSAQLPTQRDYCLLSI
jgi:hypothetical protein